MNRRTLVKAAIGSCLVAIGGYARVASPKCLPVVRVGAIRWDAWYDPQGPVGKATTISLSPPEYRFRLPFFAKIRPDSTVEIDGNRESVMDREIDYAVRAGLSYWAFVAYAPDSPMSNALRLYLQSTKKDQLKFCILSEIAAWAHPEITEWHIKLIAEPTYQTVLDHRPLYFLGPFNDAFIEKNWGGLTQVRPLVEAFRQKIQTSGIANPYIVALHQDAKIAAHYADVLGCDAISAYAVNHNEHAASFSRLVEEARKEWQEHADTGLSVVPMVTTGFDRRPRIDHPVPWEPTPQNPADYRGIYYETAQPEEIQRELEDCLAWMGQNKSSVPAEAVLVYAWNENDEGGWLIPTGQSDQSRLDAVEKVLCPK